ncbi:MAG: prephenate dehydrogenase/arogenate dehydrogenase family protein [Methylotenera sp.]|nr:prephenate dehydrogenase/arogenate dehydrogenase family protein [Methylotenera sp.]HPH08609.1 prephenate dehydrogenase/arogenate dehydrogenase family protein [Methylotenera sp.]HPM50100.1 prephenate dehydrogenase/arogenate dehydrogenase family protein [Methylotenera sp.]HQM87286.1 prephenate dehydrogenase/arogenate dehydrogenase family protein [Methylotenera sp.]
MKKLVIFGVGLIGGSVALALKKAGHATHIVGVGRSLESLQRAVKLGVIDAFETDVRAACENADLILIAAPVAQTTDILKSIQPHLNSNTVITDAGSTKGDVLRCAEKILGPQLHQFVGGHPIAGAEKSGVTAATADLFLGKNVVLTPTDKTNQDALARVKNLWQACGANVSAMPAETHDGIFASVSHLPHLLAFALVDDIAARPNAEQLFSFAASGFRDFTRIAGSHPEMWRDISLANKTALLKEITAFENELSQLKQLLNNEDGQGLQALFERASKARNQWAKTKPQ